MVNDLIKFTQRYFGGKKKILRSRSIKIFFVVIALLKYKNPIRKKDDI
jgi:hypothetical protein